MIGPGEYLAVRPIHLTVRLVYVSIPAGKRDAVRKVLERKEIDFVMTDEVGSRAYTAVAQFPVPKPAVEPLLDDLREIGIDEDAVTVVVEANTVVSRNFDRLQAEYEEDSDESDRISREELGSAAWELTPSLSTYMVLTIVSALIATAGLLLDSAAIVVGSMVIAPLVGPALAASVGTVVEDHTLRGRGVWLQLLGIIVSIAAATVFGVVVNVTGIIPPGTDVLGIEQVNERLAPGVLTLVIAIGAGVAGALSLSAGVSTALVGVMIAVALIPPAAAVGVGIAWGLSELALGAGVFVLVNILSINLSALSVLWLKGFRPETWYDEQGARHAMAVRIGGLVIALLALSMFLVGTTLAGYQAATTEAEIESEVEAIAATDPTVEVLSVSVTTDPHPLRSTPQHVEITMGTTDPPPPEVATQLRESDPAWASEATLEVRFVTLQRA